MDEMNITPFSSSRPQRLFEAVAWSEGTAGNVTTSSTKQHPQGFHNSQSNALHMTLLHPSHPPPPPSVNNNDTCNVTTSSTKQHPQGFHNSQSNTLHMTLLQPPTPPPPHPPSLYHNDVYSIGSRLRGSWKLRGNPSLEPIYILCLLLLLSLLLLMY